MNSAPVEIAAMVEAEALFGRMLDGEMTDAMIAATLVDLAERGETAADIAGAVKALRTRMTPVIAPPIAIDVCGTGGDGHHIAAHDLLGDGFGIACAVSAIAQLAVSIVTPAVQATI